ncbi:unnamed protein product [Pleuronectes platessa]|uniref:Uncharacterized protein n=1 Tax=Pleuronectes platessa TaxID=8262 RepID=A0A9N7ZC68_PLEPL|nr:unnamed protein product [Pleuronectes platessa]
MSQSYTTDTATHSLCGNHQTENVFLIVAEHIPSSITVKDEEIQGPWPLADPGQRREGMEFQPRSLVMSSDVAVGARGSEASPEAPLKPSSTGAVPVGQAPLQICSVDRGQDWRWLSSTTEDVGLPASLLQRRRRRRRRAEGVMKVCDTR